MPAPIDRLIDQSVVCTICGKPMGCDCWEKCVCGWRKRKGSECQNFSCPTRLSEWYLALGQDIASQVLRFICHRYPAMWNSVDVDARADIDDTIIRIVGEVLKSDIEPPTQ